MTREQLLDTIPQMGNRMVREFFEYQPYVSIQQFRREIGKYVDDVQVAFYEDDVFVPVDVNQSDLETMTQLPIRSWRRGPSTRTLPSSRRLPSTSLPSSLRAPPTF